MYGIEGNWVALTCRRVHEVRYEEERDALSSDWVKFCREHNFLPAAIPNCPDIAIRILNVIRPRLVIITGGNDFIQTDFGDFSECRNQTEIKVLDWAIATSTPVLGVCRGMHVINGYFGGNVQAFGISEAIHNNTTHIVRIFGLLKEKLGSQEIRTNSFHKQGVHIRDLADELEAIALCEVDKTVEALINKKSRIIGVGWHPERKNNPCVLDDIILNYLLYETAIFS